MASIRIKRIETVKRSCSVELTVKKQTESGGCYTDTKSKEFNIQWSKDVRGALVKVILDILND